MICQDEIPSFINKKKLCELTNNILNIAKDGLNKRGLGEEIFLKPCGELYNIIQRLFTCSNTVNANIQQYDVNKTPFD